MAKELDQPKTYVPVSDEESRILELRKFGDGRLDVANQDLISSGV